MNNEGFRQLINQSSKRKTTKEIAREAVEEEFNERKRKGGGRNLADGYSSNEEDDRPNPKWKRQQEGKDDAADDDNKRSNQREKKKKAKKDEGAKYRDRAKERREGKNVDYELSAGIQSTTSQIESMFTDQSKSSEEMSKYLGGDEAHTHLVKGLDKALADKVRREEMGRHTSSQNDATKNNQTKNNIDLDDVIENFDSKKRNHQQSLKQSDSTATNILQSIKLKERQSNLVAGISSFLNNIHGKGTGALYSASHKEKSIAGEAVQRTRFVFSTKANIIDPYMAWEIPQEIITPTTQNEQRNRRGNIHVRSIYLGTPLDSTLILRIDSVFKEAKTTNSLNCMQKKYQKKKVDMNVSSEKKPGGREKVFDDSDDDIFGGLGVYKHNALGGKDS